MRFYTFPYIYDNQYTLKNGAFGCTWYNIRSLEYNKVSYKMGATSLQSKSRKLTDAEQQPLKSELIGLGLITFSLCLFLALVSFSRTEGVSETTAVNLIGPVGVYLADATPTSASC